MFTGFDDSDPAFYNGRASFDEHFRCYSVAMMPSNTRDSLNYGGKVILPPSALEKLARLHISYPMLFNLNNEKRKKETNCGVLEFIAEEGRIYVPQWMMQTLLLQEGDILRVKNVSLPLGTFVKIQPQHVDFLDIHDPKAVLENALRNFSTLTLDDIVSIQYNNHTYELLIMEIKPSSSPNRGISIVETDLEVDFAPPVGYEEPQRIKPAEKSLASSLNIGSDKTGTSPKDPNWTPFQGSGYRLKEKKGKSKLLSTSAAVASTSKSASASNEGGPASILAAAAANGVPAPLKLDSENKLFFGYPYVPPKGKEGDKASEDGNKKPLGKGYVLNKTVRAAALDKQSSNGD